MNKKKILIVGGSGQMGLSLIKNLRKKKFSIHITTRSILKTKKILIQNKLKNINVLKLNVLNKLEIKKIIKFNYEFIFYFAGQSSPNLSFSNSSNTMKSNYLGCKNFLILLKSLNLKSKFYNASSSEIFSETKKKIDINSPKKPISPYGEAKLKSFYLTKKYRDKYKLNSSNIIFFNTESVFRGKNFLIPKICLAAIKAKKKNLKTKFGNLDIVREWNWADEQCQILIKLMFKKSQDFILSNGKPFSAIQMAKYAFEYFKLDYKRYIKFDQKFIRKKDFLFKKSNVKKNLTNKRINIKSKIYGKTLIYKLIKHYDKI